MADEHKGHRKRIRDRVRKESLEHFQDYQVLEYALTFVLPYKDTNLIAHELINKFGSLYAVLEADEEELMQVEGISEVSAHFLSHLLEIYRYYEQEKAKQTVTVISPDEVYKFVKQFFKGKLVEEIYLVSLSPNNKVVSIDKISQGTNCSAQADMRKIMELVTRRKVSNIVIAHNHPKGSCEPSDDDNNFTKMLVTSLTLSGCHLMDHLIIGEDDHYSYRRSSLIDQFRDEVAYMMGTKKYLQVQQPKAKYIYTYYEGVTYEKK